MLAWVGGAVAGLGFAVVGVLLFRAGLEDADRWASIIGMIFTVIGFPLSVYSTVLARRATASGTASAGVQVTATGTRAIAAYELSGSASTGDDPAAQPNPPPSAPAPNQRAEHHPDPAAAHPPPAVVRIEASGERSIAAHTISGNVSTGDTTPGTR